MTEPRLVESHHIKCRHWPKCPTEAIVNIYECGCRRISYIEKCSDLTNTCIKNIDAVYYMAPGCESGVSKFASDVGRDVAKSLAASAIIALFTGGAIIKA